MSPMVRRPLTIEHALLGFLQPGPLHGYQLHQQLRDPAGLNQVWYLKQAQLYALLGKLEEAGYITSSIQQQETRPARRVFRLTRTGREAFHNWLTSPVQRPRQMRQEFLVKVYFAQRENEQTIIALLDNQLSECQRWLEMHHRQLTNASGGSFDRVVHEYRVGQIQATLTWLQQLKSDAMKNPRQTGE